MNRIYQVSGMASGTFEFGAFLEGDKPRLAKTIGQVSETVEAATLLGAAALALAKWQAAGDYTSAEWLTFPPAIVELPEDQQLRRLGAALLPGLEG